jgi:FixJ family two-component response regulator
MTPRFPTIHIVDDDASFRASMSRLLRIAGYRTALYESGDAFLKQSPADDAGCILLDLQMSGVQDLEPQQHLAQTGSVLPIVFLTAHGDIRESVQAIKAGAEDFLPKPVSREALFEWVDCELARNLEQRRQHDRLIAIRSWRRA